MKNENKEKRDEETGAAFPCSVCGREFVPDAAHRCESCRRFACRDCLKILYHHDAQGSPIPSRTLCYDCFHSEFKKQYIE